MKSGMGVVPSVATLAGLAAAAVGIAACARSVDTDEGTEPAEAALIGGFAVNSSALDGVGSLSLRFDDDYYGEQYYDLLCSASLIAPRVALTAKHCVDALTYGYNYGGTAVFTVGASSDWPKRAVEIVDFEMAPGDRGGFVGYGNDVGVVYLGEDISDVTPLALGELGEEDEGDRYVGIGYGERNLRYDYGERRAGSLTFNALAGRTLELLFGDFASYYEWYTGEELPEECAVGEPGSDGGIPEPGSDGGIPEDEDAGIETPQPIPGPGGDLPPLPSDVVVVFPGDDYYSDCYFVEYLWEEYNLVRLEEAGDIYVGGSPGDSQPCYGDSGGPLARFDNGQLTAFGVTSGGVSSRRLQCDRGAVYARFLPKTLAFLRAALKWVDPCGDLPVSGICDGTVARRCTNLLEGKRRVVEVDCSWLGLSCEEQGDGTVGCGQDDSFADVPQPSRLGEPFPQLREREAAFFRHPPAQGR